MTRLSPPAALMVALLLVGCGGGAGTPGTDRHMPPPRQGTPAPTLCSHLSARVMGRVSPSAGSEISGLALSRSQPRVLWAVNDSGDRARVLALAPTGRLLTEVAVTGAQNVDWEDVATGPGRTLDIGDIGDNTGARDTVAVYRVPEPRLAGGAPAATAPAQRLALRYPDGAHDAEALLADPRSGALTIVTKSYTGDASVYVADDPSASAVTTLRRAGGLKLGVADAVTAGDVSADGRTVVLRTYGQAFVWPRHRGQSIAQTLRRIPCTAGAGLLDEGQGESLALTRTGRAFYTVPEGEGPKLRLYSPAR